VVAMLPQAIPELLAERQGSSKKLAQTKLKEGVYRGGGMQLTFTFRPTEPKYHVLSPNPAEVTGQHAGAQGFSSYHETLFVSVRPFEEHDAHPAA